MALCQEGPNGACTVCGVSMACDEPPMRRTCGKAKKSEGPCPHRGDKLGAIRTVCTGCNGTKIVPVPVYACSIMGTCTEQPASGETFVELSKQHRACAGCPRTPNTEG